MTKVQSVPCYLRNGGEHNVVNIPMGIFVRLKLKKLCKELLRTQKTLGTFCACTAEKEKIQLLEGLVKILSLDLKPTNSRREGKHLLTENEKNLSQSDRQVSHEKVVNLVSFSLSCGLIALLFLLASHLEYLEQFNY